MKEFAQAADSRFVAECKRILDARVNAKTADEKADADWAMQYLFQMHRDKRLDEYFATRGEQTNG